MLPIVRVPIQRAPILMFLPKKAIVLFGPSVSKEDIATIERLRQSVMLDNRYFKMLLSFDNWFKEGLIGEAEKLRREKEEEIYADFVLTYVLQRHLRSYMQ
ncbi:hypothetical protein Pyn_21820 [Prunus yedoensis var. nudiflora]|uniref:Uncharacterized protein n=1 Tax=Prunus yedoensis var. nudiflora TaxID=2094558 RepID=A0A314YCT8_PRUYE|nr:hypothetical protein Pyn_21820 [Prunus yedoensis var. nudiflora]